MKFIKYGTLISYSRFYYLFCCCLFLYVVVMTDQTFCFPHKRKVWIEVLKMLGGQVISLVLSNCGTIRISGIIHIVANIIHELCHEKTGFLWENKDTNQLCSSAQLISVFVFASRIVHFWLEILETGFCASQLTLYRVQALCRQGFIIMFKFNCCK